jgi:hypothetical protein
MSKRIAGLIAVLAGGAALAAFAVAQADTETAKADLKSATALAFAPGGVLLVGDTQGGAVYAYETGDRTAGGAGKVEIADLGAKIAALLGTTVDQVAVQDLAVNPISGNVYLAVSRGKGPDAVPVLLKADRAGKLSEFATTAKHTRVNLVDMPGASRRMETITDIGYVGGKVLIAGLSNEEFNSSLRSIAYPLNAAAKGADIEIYHGSHGRYETNSPIRTFLTYTVDGQPNVLAAYTCTPLVKIPVAALTPDAKVKGVTIAELGNVNRPLDMIAYKKDGHDYFLMANSARGVMKINADKLEGYQGITAPIKTTAGVPYETVADLKGVTQLDKVNDTSAVILVADAGVSSLRTIGLP